MQKNVREEKAEMVKEELISRSPVRVFMKSIQGGLEPGQIGLISSPSGLGKTSVLVQIALDKLLQDLKVVHISFTKYSDNVLAWYENLFEEMVGKKNVQNLDDVKDAIVKNRVFLKFTQEGVTVEQIQSTLKALIVDGKFNARTIIVDGLDFASKETANAERFNKVKDFCKHYGLSFWYSCSSDATVESAKDKRGAPAIVSGYADVFDVIVNLQPIRSSATNVKDHIALTLVKNRGSWNPGQQVIKLDPKTLLLLA
jgi:KaiC/GvpD/RAD55 family RecA-like ATPase